MSLGMSSMNMSFIFLEIPSRLFPIIPSIMDYPVIIIRLRCKKVTKQPGASLQHWPLSVLILRQTRGVVDSLDSRASLGLELFFKTRSARRFGCLLLSLGIS